MLLHNFLYTLQFASQIISAVVEEAFDAVGEMFLPYFGMSVGYLIPFLDCYLSQSSQYS